MISNNPSITAPLLDQKLVDNICSEDTTPEEQQKTRRLYGNMLTRAFQSTDALHADLTLEQRVHALHQLKGMLGNFGFSGASTAIQEWERAGAVPADEVEQRRAQARAVLEQSKAELCSRYPWLT